MDCIEDESFYGDGYDDDQKTELYEYEIIEDEQLLGKVN